MGIVNTHERGPRRVVRETDGSFTPLVTGDTAHDAPDTGYPQKMGGKASSTLPAAVASGDRVNAYLDVRGRTFVLPGSQAAGTVNVATPSVNTAAVVLYAAAGAGLAHSISGVAWSYNVDPTGFGNLKIEDGDATIVFSVDITSKGPGFFVFPEPLRGTANTLLRVTLAAGDGCTGKVNVFGKRVE